MKKKHSKISVHDLLTEALAGILSKPGRMTLTITGVVIGITSLVATLGLTSTAAGSIISQFDELAATEIYVSAKSGFTEDDPQTIPWDSQHRVTRLNGVVAAGTISEVDAGNVLVSATPLVDPQARTAFSKAILAASPGLFPAVRARLSAGKFFDAFHTRNTARVALLGINAANSLGIHKLAELPAIAIGDYYYLVTGIIANVERKHELLSGVTIPEGTARADFHLAGPQTMVVETKVGAAALITRQISHAIRPDNPGALKIEFPPEPQRVKDAVKSDLNITLLLLGGLSLVVGAFGIANITLVSVMERIGEIGLRRAMGAARLHIAAQFLLESALLGLLGGIIGDCLGIIVIVVVAYFQQWTPVLDPLISFTSPLLGMLIGIISGSYPAYCASKMEPVEALRY